MQTCKHCGAVLSVTDPVSRIDEVPRNEHTKRALEVALAGGHSITFVSPFPEAKALAGIAQALGLTGVRVVAECPCGYFNNDKYACTCSNAMITKWRTSKRYQTAMAADIVVDVPEVDPAYIGRRKGEPDEAILDRVEAAKASPTVLHGMDDLDEMGRRLMQSFVGHPQFTGDPAQILAVAESIARLAGYHRVGVACLAEAMQYRPRRK
jgi:magnesium chelatase family protein